jgi:hypothetical protein
MDYLYKKPKKEIVNPIPIELPATINTVPNEVHIPFGSDMAKGQQKGHITFISQEEYLRDIETMCQRDRWFMETVKGFCNNVVEIDIQNGQQDTWSLEQSIQFDESTSINK